MIDVPPNVGRVVIAEWSPEGTGQFTPAAFSKSGAGNRRVTVKTTYTYSKPGTYFPVLRATSHRLGDAASPYARVQNLARVRVVVK